MSILSGVSAFFGLDIGTTAIRLVELHGNGAVRSLVKYAYVPIDSKIVMSDCHQFMPRSIRLDASMYVGMQ